MRTVLFLVIATLTLAITSAPSTGYAADRATHDSNSPPDHSIGADFISSSSPTQLPLGDENSCGADDATSDSKRAQLAPVLISATGIFGSQGKCDDGVQADRAAAAARTLSRPLLLPTMESPIRTREKSGA